MRNGMLNQASTQFLTERQAASAFLMDQSQRTTLNIRKPAFDNLILLMTIVSKSENNASKTQLYSQLCEAYIASGEGSPARTAYGLLRTQMKNQCAPLLDNYVQQHYNPEPQAFCAAGA